MEGVCGLGSSGGAGSEDGETRVEGTEGIEAEARGDEGR
jgi:hypothetical protein